MHIYHYLYTDGLLKRCYGRAPGALTVSVIDCRDGLYMLLIARRYVKALPIEQGDNLLPLIAKNSFTSLRTLSVSIHAMSGDHQAIADQIAGLYYSQEEL